MTDNIIERTARAIAEYYNEDPDEVDTFQQTATGKDLARWRAYAPVVAVVLQAIREPTEGMLEAVHVSDEWNADDPEGIWRVMIEAAMHGR